MIIYAAFDQNGVELRRDIDILNIVLFASLDANPTRKITVMYQLKPGRRWVWVAAYGGTK